MAAPVISFFIRHWQTNKCMNDPLANDGQSGPTSGAVFHHVQNVMIITDSRQFAL